MFIAITEHQIFKEKTLAALNKKINGHLEMQDVRPIGNDYIITLSNADLSFLQDKKRLAQIPINNLYNVKNNDWLIYAIIVLQFITLIKG
mgnify:CR=1 FL=1|jgi:hypothetical protein